MCSSAVELMRFAVAVILQRRTIAPALLALGGATLTFALLAIMARLGTPLIWNEVVHEDGVKTFGGTLLYFEHAVRELPGDLLFGVILGGALAYACPLARPARRRAVAPLAGLLALVRVIVAGALTDVGAASLVDNLLQKHTRPGAPLEWGAHWRYHFLSSLALYLIAFGAAGLLRASDGAGSAAAAMQGKRIVLAGFAAFFVLTLVFAKSPAALARIVLDPVYLGHAARELFTGALATLPLAVGVGLLAAQSPMPAASAESRSRADAAPFLFLGVLVGAGLVLAAAFSGAASAGQTEDLVMLVAPHFFEHGLTYAIVILTAVATHRLAAGGDLRQPADAPT